MKSLVAWLIVAMVLGVVVHRWTRRWELMLLAASIIVAAAFYKTSITG